MEIVELNHPKLTTPLRQSKLDLLKTPLKINNQLTTFIEVLGIKVEICLAGLNAKKSFEFLKEYFSPFHQTDVLACAKINIHILEDYADPTNPLWWEKDPTGLFVPTQTGYQILQRDFIGRANQEFTQFDIFMPELSMDASDGIDNLLTMIYSYYLQQNAGMIVHASTVEYDNQAYVFFGHSGAGKSTLAEFVSHEYGFKVLGTDQIYLAWINNKLFAQASPRKSPEFPRGNPYRINAKREVAALMHLVQKNELSLMLQCPNEILQNFIYQSWPYLPPIVDEQQYLASCCQFLAGNIKLSEFSYPKGTRFWDYLIQNLEE